MPAPRKPIPPRTQRLIDELRAWCDAPGGYGRRSEVARALELPLGTVTHWFGGRQGPTGEQVLALQEFLRKRQRQKSATPHK
jgi:hypothetical protein